MNKYQQKLNDLKSLRLSPLQRVIAGIISILLFVGSYFFVLYSIQLTVLIHTHLTEGADSNVTHLLSFIFISIIILSLIYIFVKVLVLAFSYSVNAISGVLENSVENNHLTFSQSEFPDNWDILGKKESRHLNKQLRSEISNQHILFHQSHQAIAKRNGSDDVLFYIPRGRIPLYLVHLTYSKQNSSNWPMATPFKSKKKLMETITKSKKSP